MKLTTLYSRSVNGKTNEFTIEYFIGIDTYDKNISAYCLVRKIGKITDIVLSKRMRNNWEFNLEVEEFVVETAFSLGISSRKVTQQQFNERYLHQSQSLTSKK